MSRDFRVTLAAAAVALAGGACLSVSCDRTPVRAPAADRAPAAAAVDAAAPTDPVPAAPVVPPPARIEHPLRAARAATNLPALAESDPYARSALTRLLGRKSVLTFLSLDGFVRNFVATVDNLALKRAPSLGWPVKATPARFVTEGGGASTVIAPENAARYAPFVQLVRSVDANRAAALYVRVYPLFQQAWAELGTPGKYFNDRVVEVIDDLLATPDVAEPLRVRRAEVQGGSRATALYVFADPTLEARSAGQKILLRMGKANAAVLKAKLTEVRARIVKPARARRP
jgi:hypothetical protein